MADEERETEADRCDESGTMFLGGEHEDEAELVDRLGNRFGLPRVRRLLPRESWWPENNVEPAPSLNGASQADPWPSDRFRPVRLLARPFLLQAIDKESVINYLL